jgi:hypothetical protein
LGPIVPVEPAAARVWHPLHPAERKTALPAVAEPLLGVVVEPVAGVVVAPVAGLVEVPAGVLEVPAAPALLEGAAVLAGLELGAGAFRKGRGEGIPGTATGSTEPGGRKLGVRACAGCFFSHVVNCAGLST